MYPETYHDNDGDTKERNDPNGPITFPPPSSTPSPTPSPSQTSSQAPQFGSSKAESDWTAAIATGVPEDWARDFLRRNPNDYHRIGEAYNIQTSHRPYDSQSSNPTHQAANQRADLQAFGGKSPWDWYAQNYGDIGRAIPSAPASAGSSGGPWNYGPGATPSSYGGNIFDDPASRLIEDYALTRFNQRQNPDPNSGTARYEAYLRQLIDSLNTPSEYEKYLPELAETLKQPVYSDQQSSQLKASVYDNIERERQATKERWIAEISRRGFAPSSGPALDGLLRIDNEFNTMRTVADREFAVNAIGLTEQRRFQVADTLRGSRDAEQARQGRAVTSLQSLSGSEEDRLNQALTFATVPKQLSDNAFQQGLQLVGAGGNPQSMLSNALAMYNTVANNNDIDRARRDQSLEAIFEYIAGLFN